MVADVNTCRRKHEDTKTRRSTKSSLDFLEEGGAEGGVLGVGFGGEGGHGLLDGGGFFLVGEEGEVDADEEFGGVYGGVGVGGGGAEVGEEEFIGLVEHGGAAFEDAEGEAGDGLGDADGGDDGGEEAGVLEAVGGGEFEEGGEGFVGGDVFGEEFLEHGGGALEAGEGAAGVAVVGGVLFFAEGVFHGHGGEGGGECAGEGGDGAAAGGGGFGGGGGEEVADGEGEEVGHGNGPIEKAPGIGAR